MKVDFLIAGTQKGGTTALRAYLLNHPKICMSSRMEVHFFDSDEYFQNTPVDYSVYHQSFHIDGEQRVCGEKTPIYMYWYDVPRRVWEYNPDMRWILLLRNPIERAYSHWNMEVNRNKDFIDFWSAIQNEHSRCRKALPFQHKYHSYLDRGFYTEQLRRIWHFFPRRQILVLKSEELRATPDIVLKRICDFIGVEPFRKVTPLNVHSQEYVVHLASRERKFLATVFEYEIKELERLLKWDCSDWLK